MKTAFVIMGSIAGTLLVLGAAKKLAPGIHSLVA